MSKFHLITEEHLKDKCVYCNSELADWCSEFHMNKHYKTARCRCGKKIRISVDFLGSGHDNWDTIEKRVDS